MNRRKLVLVVEDTESDFELLKIAICKANLNSRIECQRGLDAGPCADAANLDLSSPPAQSKPT